MAVAVLVVAAALVAAAAVAAAAVVVAASRLCLQDPLGRVLGPQALACHQASQRGHAGGRGLSFHGVEAPQSPPVRAAALCASCAAAWAEAASEETSADEAEAFPGGAAGGSGLAGHPEDL